MAESTVPISAKAYRVVQELANQTGQTITAVLDKAVEDYRRKLFLEQVNAAYAALRADPKAWAAVEEERRSMAGSQMDGLDPKEHWGENGDLLPPEEGEDDGSPPAR